MRTPHEGIFYRNGNRRAVAHGAIDLAYLIRHARRSLALGRQCAESELVMFARNAEPIDNIPVYKRIALGSEAQPPRAQPCLSSWEICDALMRKREADRIWQAVVDTASGTNAPTVTP